MLMLLRVRPLLKMCRQNLSPSVEADRLIKKVGPRTARKSRGTPNVGGCPHCPLLLADKICSIISAAGAFVFRHLRIRAQRPRFVDLSVRHMPGEDLSWFLALFNPIFDDFHFVEVVGTGPTAAVVHSWNHKKSDGIFRLILPNDLRNALVINHTVERIHLRVIPAVIHQELAPTVEEWL